MVVHLVRPGHPLPLTRESLGLSQVSLFTCIIYLISLDGGCSWRLAGLFLVCQTGLVDELDVEEVGIDRVAGVGTEALPDEQLQVIVETIVR